MPKKKKKKKRKKTKHSKSHAHLQIKMIHSAKFQVNSIKDVAGVAGTRYESARDVTSSKMAETKNKKKHAHLHMIRRQSIEFRIGPMKDVRGVAGTRLDGRNDGRTHTRTDESHFYSPSPPTSGDNRNSQLIQIQIKFMNL